MWPMVATGRPAQPDRLAQLEPPVPQEQLDRQAQLVQRVPLEILELTERTEQLDRRVRLAQLGLLEQQVPPARPKTETWEMGILPKAIMLSSVSAPVATILRPVEKLFIATRPRTLTQPMAISRSIATRRAHRIPRSALQHWSATPPAPTTRRSASNPS